MKSVILDASVVAAAFFPEKYSEQARALLLSDTVLHAPDLIHAEVASVIWKRHRRNEIDSEEACELLADMLALPLELTASEQLVCDALKLALRTGRTVYDCLYVALAVQKNTIMVSGDQRLVNALSTGPLKKYVAWLGANP